MTDYFRILISGGMLALLIAGVLPACAQDIPNPFPAGTVKVLPTLPNGLRVVIREDHALPVVAMQVVVRGGSATEPKAAGVAHFLEHVVFKGSREYPEPLAAQYALETAGGISNATTSRDTTRFYASVPSDQVELLVKVFADITLHPLLTDAICEYEKPIIQAEIARQREDPVAMLIDSAYAFTYHTSPYRSSTRGSESDITAITPEAVRAFHARWYVPNNISVILVGDITVERAESLLRQTFGAARSRPLPEPVTPEIVSFRQPATAHFAKGLPNTYQVLVFATPPANDLAATLATAMALTGLTDGPDALLPACWANDGVTVRRFGVEVVPSAHPGRLLLWAETTPEMAERWCNSTINGLSALTKARITDDRLTGIKQRLATRFLLQNETYSQQADTLAFYEGVGGAELASQYDAVLLKITGEQVRAAIPTKTLAWLTLGQSPKG